MRIRLMAAGLAAVFSTMAAMPASAQVVGSVCGSQALGHDKLMALQGLYDSEKEVPKSYIDAVSDFADTCAKKVGPKIADDEDFIALVFADITMFSHREYLLSRGYKIDVLDRELGFSCNAALVPPDKDMTEEGSLLVAGAFGAAKMDVGKMNDKDMGAVATYLIASSDYWSRGSGYGLLPKCAKR